MNIWKNLDRCLPADLLYEYSQAFEIMDRKKTGKISVHELAIVVSSLGINLPKTSLYQYVRHVLHYDVTSGDDDNTRLFDFKQFVTIMVAIVTECIPEDEVLKVFEEFDRDGDGFITEGELKSLLNRIGDDDVTDDVIHEMMTEADRDGDGVVSLREFIQIMSTSVLMENRITSSLLPTDGERPDQGETKKSCRVSFDSNYANHIRKYSTISAISVYLVKDNLTILPEENGNPLTTAIPDVPKTNFFSRCIKAAKNSFRMR